MHMMAKGGGTPPIEQNGPDSGDGNLWYVICRNGNVEIVKESNIGNGEALWTPFATKKEAYEWANQEYPDKKC